MGQSFFFFDMFKSVFAHNLRLDTRAIKSADLCRPQRQPLVMFRFTGLCPRPVLFAPVPVLGPRPGRPLPQARQCQCWYSSLITSSFGQCALSLDTVTKVQTFICQVKILIFGREFFAENYKLSLCFLNLFSFRIVNK